MLYLFRTHEQSNLVNLGTGIVETTSSSQQQRERLTNITRHPQKTADGKQSWRGLEFPQNLIALLVYIFFWC